MVDLAFKSTDSSEPFSEKPETVESNIDNSGKNGCTRTVDEGPKEIEGLLKYTKDQYSNITSKEDPMLDLSVDQIKAHNRSAAKKIPKKVTEALTAEHGELVLKKHRSSLSKKEAKRLTFIRWQLDRIYDAADASSMDALELMVEQHESFSEQLNELLTNFK